MAKEIERKFLVCDTSYREMATQTIEICQGYISSDPEATVRVRLFGDMAFMTVKSISIGTVRDEWEYSIPVSDAREMLDRVCGKSIIRKLRYIVPYKGFTWEVDEFQLPDNGLIVAEVELEDPNVVFMCPPFIGEEVTGNPAYYNSVIAKSSVPADL